MRGRIRRDSHSGPKAAVALERSDGAAIALVGVCADHLDGLGPPSGLGLEPSPQVSGIAPVEDVDDLAGGGIDRGGDEPAPAPPCRRCHHGLVEPDPRGRTHPGGIAGPLTSHRLDRGPHRAPPHAEPPGQRRNRPLHRRQRVCSPPDRPGGEHPPRPGQLGPLGPGPHPAPRIRTGPHPFVPQHPQRPPARRRGIAQTHLAAPLGPRPVPATIAQHPLPIGSLHAHHHLPALLANAGHLETGRAEPRRCTSLNHQGPPESWTS